MHHYGQSLRSVTVYIAQSRDGEASRLTCRPTYIIGPYSTVRILVQQSLHQVGVDNSCNDRNVLWQWDIYLQIIILSCIIDADYTQDFKRARWGVRRKFQTDKRKIPRGGGGVPLTPFCIRHFYPIAPIILSYFVNCAPRLTTPHPRSTQETLAQIDQTCSCTCISTFHMNIFRGRNFIYLI